MEQSLEKIDIHASCFASHCVHALLFGVVFFICSQELVLYYITTKQGKKSAEIRFGKEQHWKCLTLCIKHGNLLCPVCA